MTNQTNQSCNGKWTLGNYSRWAGNFTYSGIFDSPQQACASVGMKAWSYDPQLKKYVPYDPKFGCCRVECATENNSYSIENTYHVAFRPKIEFTGASGTKTFKPANPSDNLIKISVVRGQKITVSANQPVTWKAVKGAALMGNLLTTGNVLSFLPLDLQGSIELRASSVCENRTLVLQLQPANQGNQASPAVKATAPSQNVREYVRADGTRYQHIGGSLAWRNNNEGNVGAGDFSNRHGAIGSDGIRAIFPTPEIGRKAKEQLLFHSEGGKNLQGNPLDYGKGIGYKDKTLMQAIATYAPPKENNTRLYQQTVLKAVGGKNKRMQDYTPAERQIIMDVMRRYEGWKEGEIKELGHTQ